MLDLALARRAMVDSQLRTFDVNDLRLLAAMDEVPRERFVPPGRESLAYSDADVPLDDGSGGRERRFMLAPMVLGRLIQALELTPGSKVLEVASGLGYGAAVMAQLGADVVALESDEALGAEAGRRLAALGFDQVRLVAGPLEAGWPDGQPYDGILINGAVEVTPRALLDQLADGGRLVCVVGKGRAARATLFVRSGQAFGSRALFDAAAPVLEGFRSEPGFVF